MIYGSGIRAGLCWVAHTASDGAAEMGLKDLLSRWHIPMTSRLFLVVTWKLNQTISGETSVPLHVGLSIGLLDLLTTLHLGSKSKCSEGPGRKLQNFF